MSETTLPEPSPRLTAEERAAIAARVAAAPAFVKRYGEQRSYLSPREQLATADSNCAAIVYGHELGALLYHAHGDLARLLADLAGAEARVVELEAEVRRAWAAYDTDV